MSMVRGSTVLMSAAGVECVYESGDCSRLIYNMNFEVLGLAPGSAEEACSTPSPIFPGPQGNQVTVGPSSISPGPQQNQVTGDQSIYLNTVTAATQTPFPAFTGLSAFPAATQTPHSAGETFHQVFAHLIKIWLLISPWLVVP